MQCIKKSQILRKWVLFTAALIAMWFNPMALVHAQSLAWKDSPPLAPEVKRAAQAGRSIIMLITSAPCPKCPLLKKSLLQDRPLEKLLSTQIRLTYHALEGEGLDVAQRYNVWVSPTLLVVGTNGLEKGRISEPHLSTLSATSLALALRKILDGSGTLDTLEKKLKQQPQDLALRFQVGEGWAHRGMRNRAIPYLTQVISGDPDNQKGLAARTLLIQGEDLYWRSLHDYTAAEKSLRAVITRFPQTPASHLAERALSHLRQVQHAGIKP